MSKDEKSNEWDSLWQEYTKSLENWKTLFEQVQKANNDMQTKFNEVWEKATKESSNDTMKLFGENWQNALNEAGMKSFKEFLVMLGKKHLMKQELMHSKNLLKTGKKISWSQEWNKWKPMVN
jgi:hypothetical protein